jgi:hypothetical protein
MIAKRVVPMALVVTLLGGSLARAGDPPAWQTMPAGENAVQYPPPQPKDSAADSASKIPTPGSSAPGTDGMPSGMPDQPGSAPAAPPYVMPSLSSWLTYCVSPACCGPVGGNGPIQMELFGRSGVSMTFGSGILGRLLDGNAGWDIGGGGRTLFFDPTLTKAWTVELGAMNIYNHSKTEPMPIIGVVPPTPLGGTPQPAVLTPATLRYLNRTFGDLALGREWYLTGPMDSCGLRWRIGGDVTGRFGTARAQFDQIPHSTDTIYGIGLSLHTDLEKQCGCCTWFAGFRTEWDYTWMDILQKQNDSNIQDVNFLITLGVRF